MTQKLFFIHIFPLIAQLGLGALLIIAKLFQKVFQKTHATILLIPKHNIYAFSNYIVNIDPIFDIRM